MFHQQLTKLSLHYDVTGCTFNWDGLLPGESNERILSLNVPAGNSYVSKLAYFLLRIVRLKRLKARLGIDVAISHLEGADYVNVLSGTSRTICWIHGSKKFDQNIGGIIGFIRQRFLMPLVYKRADHIAVVSNGIAAEMKYYLQQSDVPVSVVFNGFDISKIKADGSEPSNAMERFHSENLVITHCRLSRQKNIEALLMIFHQSLKELKGKLILVGDGELRENLIALSTSLGLRTWTVWSESDMSAEYDVYFMGHQANPLKFLRHATVYVMTSLWEGFPLALCEAIILGVPVISSDCPTGPKEILLDFLSPTKRSDGPISSPFGVLMPMVTVTDSQLIAVWSSVLNSMLNSATFKVPDKSLDNLFTKLDIDRNIGLTIDVINATLRRKR